MTIVVSNITEPRAYNYGWLKQQIATRLGRNDLDAYIPGFIDLAEARIYYGAHDFEVTVPPLRLPQMLVTVNDSTVLPDDFLAIKSLKVNGRELDCVAPTQMRDNGQSRYCIDGGVIVVEGGMPSEFELSYYKKFSAFMQDADTNWLLSQNPNVYVYSALIDAYLHIRDEARAQGAARMYASAANAAINSDKISRYAGPLQVRAR